LRVKGHGRGLGFFGIKEAKEAILKELLGSKELDVFPGCFSPIVDTPQGPPHVLCSIGKELEAGHRQLRNL
jgi:hypothetical protein